MQPYPASPNAIGSIVDLPLEDVSVNPRDNIRTADQSGLRELAISMASSGQLHPISVYWTGASYAVAAGFRRTLAKLSFQKEFGFKMVTACVIDSERADIVRLVENFDRQDPTTFDTCRYLYQLSTGTEGRRRHSMDELVSGTGKCDRYLRMLIRCYAVLPEHVREAWAADRDRRFTLRVLNKMAQKAEEGNDQALCDLLTSVLAPGEKRSRKVIRLESKRQAVALERSNKLLGYLNQVKAERLATDDRAMPLHAVLRAILGEIELEEAMEALTTILFDLGVEAEAI